MNLKILFLIVAYYSLFSIVFLLGHDIFLPDQYSSDFQLNQTGELTSSEIETGGLFNTGVDFGRFFSLVTLGIGLPASLPSWFLILFSAWQTLFNIFVVGFVISSIWDG